MKRVSLLQRVGAAAVNSTAAACGSAAGPGLRTCSELCCQRPQRRLISSTSLQRSNRTPVLHLPSRNRLDRRFLSTSSRRTSSWPAGAAQQEEDVDTIEDFPAPMPPTATRTRAGPMLEQDPSIVTLKQKQQSSASSSTSEQIASSRHSAATSAGGEASHDAQLPPPPRQKTVLYLSNMKKQRRPIVALTAFDYPTGLAIRSADVDICLVGDSLANVALGYATTQHVSMEEMLFACQAVHRGLSSPLLAASSASGSGTPTPLRVADMPFGSIQESLAQGTRNAIRFLRDGHADAVKIEGGEEIIPLVQHLSRFGIPVMGHIGLQPQKVTSTSGYRVQGRTADDAHAIWKQADALQAAGVFAIVLECIPSKLAEFITQRLDVPTIGIGAGNKTDGQVLVISDMVGELTSPAHVLAGLAPPVPQGHAVSTTSQQQHGDIPRPHPSAPRPPKFVRLFTPGGTTIGALRQAAVKAYVEAVRSRDFPSDSLAPLDPTADPPGGESYKMKKEEWQAFLKLADE